METIGVILFIIGIIITLIYSIRLIVIAFQESMIWGMLYLFLPFANLYFVITHWPECRAPFIKAMIGVPFIVIGVMLMPSGITY